MSIVLQGLNEEERFLRFNLRDMGLGKVAQHDHWQLLRLAESGMVEETVQALQLHPNRGMNAVIQYLSRQAKPL